MSRLSGEPLDGKWKLLSTDQKPSIKTQLAAIVADFRFIPPPPTAAAAAAEEANAVLGGGNPRRCKDTRRHARIAPGPNSTEIEFHAFLASNPARSEGDGIAMIRSYLGTDHKIGMAHGDLHPRNILVTISPGSSSRDAGESQGEASAQEQLDTVTGTSQVTVTGILDWEMRGWYPEYWEDVKARNTITIGRDSGFSD